MKWRKMLLAGIATLMLLPAAQTFAYSNPLNITDSWKWANGDFYGEGDPYILKFNGTYYLYVSTVDDQQGIKVWSSTDLVNWTYKGLCTTDPITKGAYAPEVFYHVDGNFYMYTSPAGKGHYVLKSASPLGPFVPATGNVGMGIDGSVFVDDNGQWYFYSTGADQIAIRPMSSPTQFGPAAASGLSMNGWTEGPTVIKRNGKYFMTYTGNHVWNSAYRVDYAVSSSPAANYVPASGQNPVLINTEGPNVGLGHNSIVRGPDLDSDFMVYHSHAHDGNITYPGRKINLDRIVWNGDRMTVLGPTTSNQVNPELPDFSDRFNRTSIGSSWTNVGGGTWGIYNQELMWQDTIGSAAWYRQVTSGTTAADYTAEFNTKQIKQGTTANPLYGAVFSYTNESNYGVAVLNRSLNRLETQYVVGGVSQGWQYASLPSGFDYTKWHQIRVEKSGTAFTVYVDGMNKQTRNIQGLGGGKVGYTTSDAHADFGYVAYSGKVGGSSAWNAYKPAPGTIEAVHYVSGAEGTAYHDLSSGNTGGAYRSGDVDIRLSAAEGKNVVGWNQTGEWMKYRVNVAESGTYDLDVRAATTFANAKFRVWDGTQDLTGAVGVKNTGDWENWQTTSKKGIYLTAGNHELRFEIAEGEFDFSSMTLTRSEPVAAVTDNFDDGNDNGWTRFEGDWSVTGGQYTATAANSFAKTTIGSDRWADYTVETDIRQLTATGDSGVLVRVNNPSNGKDRVNNPDYVQGYYAFIKPDGVYLGKMNYGYTALANTPVSLPANTTHHMKVVVNGTNIKIYVGDMNVPKIDYNDNSANAFTHGKAGLRAMNNNSQFDQFQVRP
ncbi:family 43 glycosylhydrolase [Saccharibacillus sp. CPCC 101409]|uniref:family 43 glycosylhydrolase n=1 Tax=Saccharibacillus sp. CPCC 101409 TaxID=3058041 RepID=UPI00267414E4|nr:family 43 glycosylhydrolase [Saccharibacillus sp. CPCC 101409]MDO3408440.1 family 43 glycosylhydrolase [Saccharibacillus sp. CPCC 101409]